MEIKKNIPNDTVTRKLVDIDHETGNVYKSINIIARRANQIAAELILFLRYTPASQRRKSMVFWMRPPPTPLPHFSIYPDCRKPESWIR